MSVFVPSRYKSAVSDGLISIVQEETLDDSWIPITQKEWRVRQENEEDGTLPEDKKVIHSMNFIHSLCSIQTRQIV